MKEPNPTMITKGEILAATALNVVIFGLALAAMNHIVWLEAVLLAVVMFVLVSLALRVVR